MVEQESPKVQVIIIVHHAYFNNSSGTRKYSISTPSRKKCVKKIARKNYVSMASTFVNSLTTAKAVVSKLAIKIKNEMRNISSSTHDSILRDCNEAVRRFHWDTVMCELVRKTPTLMSLLIQLVGKPTEEKKHYSVCWLHNC